MKVERMITIYKELLRKAINEKNFEAQCRLLGALAILKDDRINELEKENIKLKFSLKKVS